MSKNISLGRKRFSSKKIPANTVLITGGSSGIGFELSKIFAQKGSTLIIVSKPEQELKNAKDWFMENYPEANIIYMQKDLAIPGAAQEIYNAVKTGGYTIDILINNAGFATWGYCTELPIDRELDMINLNVVNVYHMTRLFLNDMVARDSGRILNVSSIAAFLASPLFTTYSATKSFVFNFTIALNQELKMSGSNVRATALCPPATRTKFQETAHMGDKTFNGLFAKDAPFVAKAAYEALLKGKEMVIPGKHIALFVRGLSSQARKSHIFKINTIKSIQF